MAITTFTVSKQAGWAATDVILQLEESFTWLGWNGNTQSGIVTGISSYSGGGTVGTSSTDYYDVFPVSTSGIGTGASFLIDRSSGPIIAIYVNRPGVGYTDGEVVQISPEDIGGSANGAVGIAITLFVAGRSSPIGYGTTTAFYDKDVNVGSSNPWGTLRHTIEPNKKFGDTYRVFQVTSSNTLSEHVGSSFHPWDGRNTSNGGNGYENRLSGNTLFDIPYTFSAFNAIYFANNANQMSNVRQTSLTFANSNAFKLDLNIFRSGIDPNFAVFSYRHPDISSLRLRDNTYATFFFHNFTTSLWDLDNLFLGGITEIIPNPSDSSVVNLEFRTHIDGETSTSGFSYIPSKRCAEFGYSSWTNQYSSLYLSSFYGSNSAPLTSDSRNPRIYLRNNSTTSNRGNGGYFDGITYIDRLPSETNFNAVIKGIPLNTNMIPCPYYIPDDFVLIDFDYATPSTNIQQGDTITISGSEVYTVITGSYNQTTRTRGILFCARTV
jgi:hypothetical protein